MNCPDCNTKMDLIDEVTDRYCQLAPIEEPYWKCPKCKIEVEAE